MCNVLRLNARTFPILPGERAVIEEAGHRLIEAELPEECVRPAEIDAVMIVSAYFRSDMLARFPRCRIISRLGNGCDKIDCDAAARLGIPVANVPDSFSAEVADHTMALLLALLRKLPQQDALMRSGHRPADVFGVRRIAGLTLGLVGFGHIAGLVAERARAFGMRIAFFDPGRDAAPSGTEKLPFADLLRTADAIVLQCPLTAATRGMLGEAEFRLMKPEAVLVNTARGELLDEAALVRALSTGRLAAAGLDVFGGINVFTEGGFPTDHPFFRTPNLVLTPHVAANSVQGRLETHCRGARAVVEFFNGREPEHIVNRKLWKESKNV